MPDDSIEITLDAARVDPAAAWALLRTTYWSTNIRREVVENALANSLVAGALHRQSGELVGIARAVTDRATFAWLCDVFVLEPHRGKGLATRMVQALIAHPDLQTLRRWCLATRDAHEVYRPLGFQPVPPDRWMELVRDTATWRESLSQP